MEQACIKENIERFSQSNNTPPMTEPLVSELGFLGNMEEAQSILNDTYQPPEDIDPYAKLLIQELHMPENTCANPMKETEVTPTSNKSAWNKQKEQISSDPDGLSFSHYKAACQDPKLNLFDTSLCNLP